MSLDSNSESPSRWHTPHQTLLWETLTSDTAMLTNNLAGQTDVCPKRTKHTDISKFAPQMAVGDVVFIRVMALPFKKVANTTASWTNHVGIVIDTSGPEPVIAESTFPFSKVTTLSRFVARSEQGRIVVRRLNHRPSREQQIAIQQAAQKRIGIFYDTGFDINSSRQFCSRFVREVLAEATGIQIGKVEQFSTFLAHTQKADLMFWRLWYFGKIPWQRQTVTPDSLLRSTALHTVYSGACSALV